MNESVVVLSATICSRSQFTYSSAGGPSLHCTIPTEGAPSLRFLQVWVAMLPAQLLSVLHHPLCMPSSYPPFAYANLNGLTQAYDFRYQSPVPEPITMAFIGTG